MSDDDDSSEVSNKKDERYHTFFALYRILSPIAVRFKIGKVYYYILDFVEDTKCTDNRLFLSSLQVSYF